MWLSYSFGFISYNILAIMSLLAINYNLKIKGSQKKMFSISCCTIYFFIATLGCAITNDFYPYKEIISIIHSTQEPFLSVEPFWINTIKYFNLSHYQYIILLESTSFILFYHILRQLNPKNIILFISLWTLLSFISMIGGRGILFYMTFILGFTMFANKKYVIGIFLVSLSFFFHKTAYIGIPLFILSLIPFSRKMLILIFMGVIVASLVLRVTVINNIDFIYESISGAGIPGAIYITYEENINATGLAIWRIFPIISYTMVVLFSIFTLCRLHPYLDIMTYKQKKIYYITFWGLMLSIALRLLNLPDPAISVRVLSIVITPIIYLYLILKEYSKPLRYEHRALLLTLIISFLIGDIGILRVLFINDIFS